MNKKTENLRDELKKLIVPFATLTLALGDINARYKRLGFTETEIEKAMFDILEEQDKDLYEKLIKHLYG